MIVNQLLVFLACFIALGRCADEVLMADALEGTVDFEKAIEYKNPSFPSHYVASSYEVQPGNSILRFFLLPADVCHTVVLCSTKKLDDKTVINETEHCIGDKLTFRMLENSVQLNDDAKKIIPSAEIVMERGNGHWSLKVANPDKFDGVNFETAETIQFKLADSSQLLMLKSSPHCNARLGTAGNGVNPATVTKLDSKGTPKNNDHDKNTRTTAPIANSQVTGAKKAKNNKCCNDLFSIEGYQSGAGLSGSKNITYKQYEFKKNPKTDGISSIRLEHEVSPSECPWVRVCFGDKAQDICSDPKKSIDLIYDYGIIIPSDSDQARYFGVNPKRLGISRLRFIENQGKATHVRLEYAFEGGVPLVEENMVLDWDFTDRISVAAGAKCRVGVHSDYGVPTKQRTLNDVQQIRVRKCECYE